VSSRQQPFATLGNLERLGLATKALQALPVLWRRDGIKTASGIIEPYLRKRHLPPFVVEHDPDFDDLSGFTGNAQPIWSLAAAGPITPGGQARPMDVLVAFPAGGTVGVPGITYNVTAPDAGAYNTSTVPTMPAGPTLPFPLTGIVTIGGYPFELALGGTVNPGDAIFFCLRTDAGLTGACILKTAFILLNARGVDPKTQETLKDGNAACDKWCEDVASGKGDLGKDADASPTIQEGGVRFKAGREQRDPYGWLKRHGGGEPWGGLG
jgi:hypothetical protein